MARRSTTEQTPAPTIGARQSSSRARRLPHCAPSGSRAGKRRSAPSDVGARSCARRPGSGFPSATRNRARRS
eukprot:4396004-Pleurochrysis_carterae.AAC.1